MLPQEALLYPLYYGARTLGLTNTIWGVVIIFTVIQAAFGTYLLASVLHTFPREILEAGALDGANRWRMLWRIVFPMRVRRCRCCWCSSSSGLGTSS